MTKDQQAAIEAIQKLPDFVEVLSDPAPEIAVKFRTKDGAIHCQTIDAQGQVLKWASTAQVWIDREDGSAEEVLRSLTYEPDGKVSSAKDQVLQRRPAPPKPEEPAESVEALTPKS